MCFKPPLPDGRPAVTLVAAVFAAFDDLQEFKFVHGILRVIMPKPFLGDRYGSLRSFPQTAKFYARIHQDCHRPEE